MSHGLASWRRTFCAASASVNVEGWALYAEAEVKPCLPLDGQLAEAVYGKLIPAEEGQPAAGR